MGKDKKDREIRYRCGRCGQLVMSDSHNVIDPNTRRMVPCR